MYADADVISRARALAAEQLSYYGAFIPSSPGADDAREAGALLVRPDADEIQEITSSLRRAVSGKRVLDVCCGSGQWTACYHDAAAEITLLDASAERLDACRERFGAQANFTYVKADVFEWEAAGNYDTIVVTFWLSHIPQALFGGFWDTLLDCLAPHGEVFFADHRSGSYCERPNGASDPVVERTVADGRTYQVVKRLYEPSTLAEALSSIGWSAEVSGTRHFVYGMAGPLPPGQPGRRHGRGREAFPPGRRVS